MSKRDWIKPQKISLEFSVKVDTVYAFSSRYRNKPFIDGSLIDRSYLKRLAKLRHKLITTQHNEFYRLTETMEVTEIAREIVKRIPTMNYNSLLSYMYETMWKDMGVSPLDLRISKYLIPTTRIMRRLKC